MATGREKEPLTAALHLADSVYLFILQHGDAVDKSVDPQRPLSDNGVRAIENIAAYMRDRQLEPGYIFHSGKLRARQSAQIIAVSLALELEPVQADGLGPNDDPAMIIEDIARLDRDVLIASHMPFVSRLCSVLLSGGPDCVFASVPGSLIFLETNPQGWQMNWMLRPELL